MLETSVRSHTWMKPSLNGGEYGFITAKLWGRWRVSVCMLVGTHPKGKIPVII